MSFKQYKNVTQNVIQELLEKQIEAIRNNIFYCPRIIKVQAYKVKHSLECGDGLQQQHFFSVDLSVLQSRRPE